MRKALFLSILIVFVLSLGGCATARKQKDLEIQGLRSQVSTLEAQVQSKDEEINALRESLAKAPQEKESTAKRASAKKVIGEVKSRPTTKQIQMALANAGYDPGAIDGKKGRRTKEAIRSFQRANNLSADGKVGKRTWVLLRGYLYKKVK
jgi:peptidoglycan hydrolase-like protein with peptidoglycan-binding domain